MSSQNYIVRAAAYPCVAQHNANLSTSRLSVWFCFNTIYSSKLTEDMLRLQFPTWQPHNTHSSFTRIISDDHVEKIFNLSCHSLSFDKVCTMISYMNIPFASDRLQWKGDRSGDWVSLANQEVLVHNILSLFHSKIAEAAATVSEPKERNFLLIIEKEVLLPYQEFEKIVDPRVQERMQEISEVIFRMSEQEMRLGRPSRSTWERMIFKPLRELAEISRDNLVQAMLWQTMARCAQQYGWYLVPDATILKFRSSNLNYCYGSNKV